MFLFFLLFLQKTFMIKNFFKSWESNKIIQTKNGIYDTYSLYWRQISINSYLVQEILVQLNPLITDRSVQQKPFVLTWIRYKCSHGLCIKNISFSWKYKIYKVFTFKFKIISFCKTFRNERLFVRFLVFKD